MTDAATTRFRASMTTFVVAVIILSASLLPTSANAQRQMEALGRGVVACKTADGTVDGRGKVIGDANADCRPLGGIEEEPAT